MDTSINFFFEKDSKWKEEYKLLRDIILETGLEEELKWGKPCYTFNGNNVILIHGFKEYCAVLLHKGVLLKDAAGILIQQTPNVQVARQIRFTGTKEISELSETLKEYVYEAIEVEKAGIEPKMKKTSEFEMVDEFKSALQEDPSFKNAFESLTPGRQRGYLLYFSQAKQSKTRQDRIEKYKNAIMNGKGLND
ncbi:MAG: YdeI/OmpD-associated family protein [Saprospiraceae bacterium]